MHLLSINLTFHFKLRHTILLRRRLLCFFSSSTLTAAMFDSSKTNSALATNQTKRPISHQSPLLANPANDSHHLTIPSDPSRLFISPQQLSTRNTQNQNPSLFVTNGSIGMVSTWVWTEKKRDATPHKPLDLLRRCLHAALRFKNSFSTFLFWSPGLLQKTPKLAGTKKYANWFFGHD